MEIDYSIIHLPLKIKSYKQRNFCHFCTKKFDEGFIVSTNRGGCLTCRKCKNKIDKYVENRPVNENLINQKNIFSGGSWESNRSKH